MGEWLLMAVALAAYAGSLLQCRVSMHEVAAAARTEPDAHAEAPSGLAAFLFGLRVMFRRPLDLRIASGRDLALTHAQGWLWVNLATAGAFGLTLHGLIGDPVAPAVVTVLTIINTSYWAGVTE